MAPPLDEMDDSLKPLAQAIGRAVLGAALVEKILLLDLAERLANRDGMTEELLGAETRTPFERQALGPPARA